MAGTKAGGQKAAAANKAKYGADFYARIGAAGGKNGRTGGFAANPELARIAGAKGGRISRRKKVTTSADATVTA
jgi:general stress protein YciG